VVKLLYSGHSSHSGRAVEDAENGWAYSHYLTAMGYYLGSTIQKHSCVLVSVLLTLLAHAVGQGGGGRQREDRCHWRQSSWQ